MKSNYLKINALIHHLAYDMALDEAFREDLFSNEDEVRWLNGCVIVFHKDFRPIYERWADYFLSRFKEYEL